MQACFSNCSPSQPEELQAVKADYPTPRTTRRREGTFLGDDVDLAYTIVVPEMLQKRSREEPVWVPRSTESSKADILKAVNEKKDNGRDH